MERLIKKTINILLWVNGLLWVGSILTNVYAKSLSFLFNPIWALLICPLLAILLGLIKLSIARGDRWALMGGTIWITLATAEWIFLIGLF